MTHPNPSPPRRRGVARLARALFFAVLAVVLLGLLAGIWLWSQIRGSLPTLDGELTVAGVAASVRIERDDQGVPTIRAEDRFDAAHALGFLHAQDRFFQMDLTRRRGAGELAELFGEAALRLDKRHRLHRFRARAQRVFATLPAIQRRLIESYAQGVNEGLEALGNKPFEYVLLRSEPAAWLPEDSLLVAYSMYFELQGGGGRREADRGTVAEVLPPELVAFLMPRGSDWDAPVDGIPVEIPAMPGPEVFDLRRAATAPPAEPIAEPAEAAENRPELDEGFAFGFATDHHDRPEIRLGSNNWAVSGAHTAHGGALVADDMHLGFSVPNVWYRASIVLPGDDGEERRLTGVTLPGIGAVVVGSNGKIAWAFTNSYGDWIDRVILEPAPEDDGAYLTPSGPRSFEVRREVLEIAGGGEEIFEVRETIWGPVIGEDHLGREHALRWVAHDDAAVNLALADLHFADGVEDALEVAHRAGIPAQNFVVGDAEGRIAWTIIGPIPRRGAASGRLPASWATAGNAWRGYIPSAEVPVILDPEEGRIWTANARVVGGEALDLIGDGGYDLGARAGQIRDGLRALDQAAPADFLALQLDDRALFLERWKELLLRQLEGTRDPRRAAFREAVSTTWTGRASVDSAAYRLVRAFRRETEELVFTGLAEPVKALDEDFAWYAFPQREGTLWTLLEERPAHLLSPQWSSWDELLLAAVDGVSERMLADGAAPETLKERTWGELNQVQVRHPLTQAVPSLSRWLDLPSEAASGDNDMPKVLNRSFGASQRIAVAPGREEEAIFHMPGGQSGHPMSPFFDLGYEDWLRGKPSPLLPGAKAHELVLRPAAGGAS